ncbi:MAG: MMPL family transporter, partial [Myxococcales bacterium]|nr:MMPL family transporter [Myxococcales bacterium]
VSVEALAQHDFSVRLTGQPVIGQAFAQSVTQSLRSSTLVSLAALAVVLLLFRQVRALVPAVWTVMITAGVIELLGHPISIGTGMVACIALGAGVDFAIHLGVRARGSQASHPGREATDALGGVILATGVQLAVAFLVLLASEMPPLQQFGVGLAVGLMGAATGAVWLTPRLFPPRRG